MREVTEREVSVQKFSQLSICAAAIGWQIDESAQGIGEDVEEL